MFRLNSLNDLLESLRKKTRSQGLKAHLNSTIGVMVGSTIMGIVMAKTAVVNLGWAVL